MASLRNYKEVPLVTSPPIDHRCVARVPGDTIGPLQLRAELAALSFSANVRDVSVQGIGLVAKQSFILGTSLVIEGGPAGRGLPVELKATVRHATLLSDGRWLLGCIFSRPLTLDDFKVLG